MHFLLPLALLKVDDAFVLCLKAKMKFSAHPCGSGCEGDFCCNTLLYDVHCGALIDPTGKGIQDSVNFVLRHNRADFASWIREDRYV